MIFNYHVPTMYVYRKEYLGKKLRMKFNNEVTTIFVLWINVLRKQAKWNSTIMSPQCVCIEKNILERNYELNSTMKSPLCVYCKWVSWKWNRNEIQLSCPAMYVYRKEYLEKKLIMKFSNKVPTICVFWINVVQKEEKWYSTIMFPQCMCIENNILKRNYELNSTMKSSQFVYFEKLSYKRKQNDNQLSRPNNVCV